MSEVWSMGRYEAGAELAADGRYRYRLWRAWGGGPRLLFLMLNPSTADARVDDPTIRRCVGFAKREKFDGIEVVNLFAFRSSDPRRLRCQEDENERWIDPVGPENDLAIRAAAERAPVIVCAWGRIPCLSLRPRADVVRKLLAFEHPTKPLKCLGYTSGRDPRHPLMLRRDQALEDYRP